jgi:membrane protease YdiL (CAAX protease family)
MQKPVAPISLFTSVVLFGVPTILFLLVADGIIPYFTQTLHLHPAMSWFIGGSIVFIPLFVTTVILVRRDGFHSWSAILERLRIQRLSPNDWKYLGGSVLVIGILTGLIMGAAQLLHTHFGLPPLDTSVSFMDFEPLKSSERWMLSVWAFMFFFNIVGEEILWRGYILPRQEAAVQQHAWIMNALLWMIFHIVFGLSLMLLLLPIIVVLPYAVQRTKNTSVGMILHALLNGPSFVLISFGVIQ